jgi:hypothetical protein
MVMFILIKNGKNICSSFLCYLLPSHLGSLVENQRDHYIETVRAEELGKTLYEELKSDSANLEKVITNRVDKEQHIMLCS